MLRGTSHVDGRRAAVALEYAIPGRRRAAGCAVGVVRRRRRAARRRRRPSAALYKWTDANGRVIYSDQPPPGNVKVETINAPPPPANPNAVKDLANKEVELQKKKQARAEDDTKANKARVDANMRRQECQRARGQAIALAQVRPGRALHHERRQGERVAMDDAARLAERQRLDYWISENCQNIPSN